MHPATHRSAPGVDTAGEAHHFHRPFGLLVQRFRIEAWRGGERVRQCEQPQDEVFFDRALRRADRVAHVAEAVAPNGRAGGERAGGNPMRRRIEARHLFLDQKPPFWTLEPELVKGGREARITPLVGPMPELVKRLAEQYPEGPIFRNRD